VIAEHHPRHAHDHRLAPVRFRDVEPEVLQAVDDARGRLRQQPERVDRAAYWSAPAPAQASASMMTRGSTSTSHPPGAAITETR